LANCLQENVKPNQIDMETTKHYKDIGDRYQNWYLDEGNSAQLAHYFRILYRILEYIDAAKIDDKKLYVKILRAQLSEQELAILFYNSFIPEGKKMQKHIEKYALLKHMNEKYLGQRRDKEFYNSCAYEDNQT
jgi:hypothetical protein